MILLILLLCLPLELISARPALPDWTPPEVCASAWQSDGATISWQHGPTIRSFYLEVGDQTVSAASFTPRSWELRQQWPQVGRAILAEYSEGKIEGTATYRLLWYRQYVPLIP